MRPPKIVVRWGTERLDMGPGESSRHRLPWLVICLVNGLCAGAVVAMFEETLQSLVALAVFMPILAGMGGNAGTQAFAVIVRAMALNEVRAKHWSVYLSKELWVGLRLGLTNGLIVFALAWVWKGSLWLSLVVGASMAVTLTCATVVGAIVPLGLKWLSVDPAIASGPFITTIVDILGLVIYLGLATLFLRWTTATFLPTVGLGPPVP